MTLVSVLLLLAVLLLGYSNGANDTFKGVATLFGSGTSTYRQALAWGVGTTMAGSLLALVLARGLVTTFQGKGLLPEVVTVQPAFLLAVSVGAALTVLLASWAGLPVATTHALLGGLAGAGWLAADGEVRLDRLGTSVALPMLFSPVAALLLTTLLDPLLRRLGAGPALGDSFLKGLHYLSGGAVGFARGTQATPKIVALLLAGDVMGPYLGLVLVALAMLLGGVLSARAVAETLSCKITRMTPGQGCLANLVTAGLVIGAGWNGLPVSTTHVSVGALFGIGVVNHTAATRAVSAILLAWVTTLPLAAVTAAGLFLLFQTFGIG